MKPVKRARRIAALAMAGLLLLLSACTPASPKAALAKAFAGMARLDSLSFTAQVQWEQDGVQLSPMSFHGDWIKEPLAMRIESSVEIDPQIPWDMTVTAYILEEPEDVYTLYTGIFIPELTDLWYSQDITDVFAFSTTGSLMEAAELYLEGLQELSPGGGRDHRREHLRPLRRLSGRGGPWPDAAGGGHGNGRGIPAARGLGYGGYGGLGHFGSAHLLLAG